MPNLLEETKRAMTNGEHSIKDIIFIGSERSGHSCTWEQFKVLANKEYASNYGTLVVAKDLIIVFSTGHKMWRSEYDGSEYWEYTIPFKRPAESKPIVNLFAENRSWRTLAKIQKDEEESLK